VIHILREFGSDPRQLTELRRLVRDCCRRAWAAGAREEAIDRVELGVHEAATNILRHAYRGTPGGPIRLDLVADADHVGVTLCHDGADFDPTAVPGPAFDGTRTGGFGLYLIHQCMDEVCYIHGEPGRRGVRMVRLRAGPAGERPMNVFVETFGDVAVVTVNAEHLEVGNADDMRAAMDPVLRDHRRVVLDLSRLEFVDSRGCGVILSCLKGLAERGGDLKLCRVTPPVRAVFDLIRLHKVCEITDTREQAIASFGG
jgi:anti-sigma B factor antagonist